MYDNRMKNRREEMGICYYKVFILYMKQDVL